MTEARWIVRMFMVIVLWAGGIFLMIRSLLLSPDPLSDIVLSLAAFAAASYLGQEAELIEIVQRFRKHKEKKK